MKNVIDRMHMAELTIACGMTEKSSVSFQTHPDDPLNKKVGSEFGQTDLEEYTQRRIINIHKG